MNESTDQLLIKYQHKDCPVRPDVEWFDLWSSACNGVCPACGLDEIEPVDWLPAQSCFTEVSDLGQGE